MRAGREVSDGRRRFTIAHEFGHYLMHRSLFPKGLECNEEAVKLEAEADTFAAYLLMPLDDFRRQIPADADPTLDDLSAAAERYGVSLIACVLRWLEYSTRCSMLVISRDGFILWARASEPAFMSGLFIRSKNVAPVEVPSASLPGRAGLADVRREGVDHPPGVWFSEDCHEITITASVWASGTPPSDTATTSGSGWTLALQFAHPRLGHESKYAPIITRQRKEPCP